MRSLSRRTKKLMGIILGIFIFALILCFWSLMFLLATERALTKARLYLRASQHYARMIGYSTLIQIYYRLRIGEGLLSNIYSPENYLAQVTDTGKITLLSPIPIFLMCGDSSIYGIFPTRIVGGDPSLIRLADMQETTIIPLCFNGRSENALIFGLS